MKALILIVISLISQIGVSQSTTEMIEIKFVGEYITGRAPCEWLPNGSRRWAKTTGFVIDKIVEGNLAINYVEIAYDAAEDKKIALQGQQKYLVTLELTKNRAVELGLNETRTVMTYKNPIKYEEILKIEEK
ncbi:MAG: hypothetical protein ACFB0B_03840 [Thermonemataceae bacterium]